jgi:hypothetical protein
MTASPTLTQTAPQLLLEFAGQFPAPMPEHLQHENAALLAQYLNSWTRTFGQPNYREDGDFEHFVENMARFDAASRAFGYQNTTIRQRASHLNMSWLFDFDGELIAPAEEAELPAPDFVFGPVASWGSSHAQERRSDPADHYWDIPAFEALSGRQWALAGYCPDDQNEPDLLAVLQGMFDDGIRRFVVKGTAAKTLLVDFTLTVRPTSLYGDSEIPSEILDGVLHREGHSRVFLVQEHIPMIDEYRFFMAGNQPASGAGCIEHFTPLDSRGTAFDGRTEGKRGSGMVADEAAVVNRLRDFAADAGALLHEQAPELGAAWVMDLAINQDTDEIVLIELNPARNAGLYASSPSAWMGAVRDWVSAAVTFEPDQKEGTV